MTTLSVLNTRQKSKQAKLTKNSKIFKTIIKAIQSKKGNNIISLDLKKIPEAVADFFLICEANSNVQIKAIADAIEDQVKDICGELPYKHEGYKSLKWVLIDYVNIVVHVMQPETRQFYKIEEMWSDASQHSHEEM